MRVDLLNTMDRSGGAARAAHRLHQGLRAMQVDSRMLVQLRTGNDAGVTGNSGKTAATLARLRLLADQLPVLPRRRRQRGVFAPALIPGGAWRAANRQQADIIHLHWITKAFLGIADIPRLNAPLVWTLHDMWPMTGGCHYDLGCGRYTDACGRCPVLGSEHDNDLSARLLQRRQRAWRDLDLTIVSPSHWLAGCARNSTLLHGFRTEVIPNGIDLDCFRPVPKSEARAALSIDPDARIILFGAMGATADERKGYRRLRSALQILSGRRLQARLLVFGATRREPAPVDGLPVQFAGRLQSDRDLACLYSAADVFVAPSAQDNLPNTIMEALACGTPCVAFRVGGIPDMIRHRDNGYLAEPGDSGDLAAGIEWTLADPHRLHMLSLQARRSAEDNYDLTSIAGRYLALYREILGHRARGTRAQDN